MGIIMRKRKCYTGKIVNREWTSIGEITSTTETSTSSINLSLIPNSAKEVLVEMGWRSSGSNLYVITHTLPKAQALSTSSFMWNYCVGASSWAYFVFYPSNGKIGQFIAGAPAISEVYTKVYYR